MPFLHDRVLDFGLNVLTSEATRLDLCTTEPAFYEQAISAASLGSKNFPSIGTPEDRSPNGRRVTIAALAGGNVTASGLATHWALTDTNNGRLLAAGPLQAPQVVAAGNNFSLSAFDIGMPGVG